MMIELNPERITVTLSPREYKQLPRYMRDILWHNSTCELFQQTDKMRFWLKPEQYAQFYQNLTTQQPNNLLIDLAVPDYHPKRHKFKIHWLKAANLTYCGDHLDTFSSAQWYNKSTYPEAALELITCQQCRNKLLSSMCKTKRIK